jgi:hypothetical protein
MISPVHRIHLVIDHCEFFSVGVPAEFGPCFLISLVFVTTVVTSREVYRAFVEVAFVLNINVFAVYYISYSPNDGPRSFWQVIEHL